jgi:3'-phosphoadenosine 5'-phosphosulfate sulfotransferase (PAPS reductase)/FAD synthetase
MEALATCGILGKMVKRVVRQISTSRNLAEYHVWLLNLSGGKDSQELLRAVVELADQLGMRDRLVLVHADLGRMEWEGTRELVEEWAEHYGLPLHIVRREIDGVPQDLLEQIQQRGKFPDSARRYCTSDHKRGPVRKLMTALAKIHRAVFHGEQIRILNIMGMRADESPARAKRSEFSHEGSRTCPCSQCRFRASLDQTAIKKAFAAVKVPMPKALKVGSGASNTRRHVDEWLPIHSWSEEDVWAGIEASGTRTHWAYKYMPRLSCRFCVLASKSALVTSAKLNPELAQEYADVETEIGHDFRQDLPMREIIKLAEASPLIERAESWAA